MAKKSKGNKGNRRGVNVIEAAEEYFQTAMGRRGRVRRKNLNQMDYDKMVHALKGDMRPNRPGGTGYHYRPDGKDFPGRRIVPGSEQPVGSNGVYQAKPEYQLPDGDWQPKAGNNGVSTFFPKDWTPKQVDTAVSSAYRNSKPDPANPNAAWIGTHNGVRIMGYYDRTNGRGYTHGFPAADQP